MAATGLDVAQLAIYRLLWLQGETRWAVRSRHAESATMLARASIETLIVGLYCLHEEQAVTQLQSENLRSLGLLLRYLSDEGLMPTAVVDECIRRLAQGTPARGPSPEFMARKIDKATGGAAAVSLYERFYRPTASLAVHASGLTLMRHVRADDTLARRPRRVWARRSPARIADACVGVLAAAVAREAGPVYPAAEQYASRHLDRALTPVAMFGAPGLGQDSPAGPGQGHHHDHADNRPVRLVGQRRRRPRPPHSADP